MTRELGGGSLLAGAERPPPPRWASAIADRRVALVGPHGAAGATAIASALRVARSVGLFESRALLGVARRLGYHADVVVEFPDGVSVADDLPWYANPPAPQDGSEERHVVFFSSGSTGEPKLIERSLASLHAEADRYVGAGVLRPDDRLALAAPLFHAYGAGVLAAALQVECELVVVDPTSLGQVVAELTGGATVAAMLPFQARLLARRRAEPRPATCRLVMAGAGPVTDEMAAGFEAAFGIPLGRNYGSTETGAVAWGAGPLPGFAVGSPFPTVDIRLLDEAGEPVTGDGVPGEVVVELEDGTVRHMGDLGKWSAGGTMVSILGRTDDAPRRHGKFTPTALIEATAEDVVGVEAARARVEEGERLVLEVHGSGYEEDKLRSRLGAALGPWAIPDAITQMEAPPARTAAGKLAGGEHLTVRVDELLRTFRSSRIAAAVATLARFGFFSAVANGETPDELAERHGLDPRQLGSVVDMLAEAGILEQAGAAPPGLPDLAAFEEMVCGGPNHPASVERALTGVPFEWPAGFRAAYVSALTIDERTCRTILRLHGLAPDDGLAIVSTSPQPWSDAAAGLGVTAAIVPVEPGRGPVAAGEPWADPPAQILIHNAIHYGATIDVLRKFEPRPERRLIVADVFVRPDGRNAELALDWVTHGEGNLPRLSDLEGLLRSLGWTVDRRAVLGILDHVSFSHAA